MLYLILLLVLYVVFYKKITFPASQSSEKTITFNLQEFEISSSTQSEEAPQNTQEPSLEERTKNLFEKIAHAHDSPDTVLTATNEKSLEEITKNLLKKISDSQKKPVKKVLPDSNFKQKISKAQLAKKAQEKRIKEENEKKIAQEAAILAQLEQEHLAKVKAEENEKLKKLEEARLIKEQKKEEEHLKTIAQEKAKKKKQEHLEKIAEIKRKQLLAKQAKIQKEKLRKEKIKKIKQRLAKEKLRKQKLEKKRKARKKLTKHKSKHTLSKNIMNTGSTYSKPNKSSTSMKMIKQFYGSEFNSFTGTQKAFIEKNLGSIYQITQRTLTRNGYPEVAARTQQQGTQLVTFYLHPNGSISQLHYKRRLGFESLDKNTMKIIKIAYKNYPKPKTTTKITFYVQYSLF